MVQRYGTCGLNPGMGYLYPHMEYTRVPPVTTLATDWTMIVCVKAVSFQQFTLDKGFFSLDL